MDKEYTVYRWHGGMDIPSRWRINYRGTVTNWAKNHPDVLEVAGDGYTRQEAEALRRLLNAK